ncbi:PKD domain-containing protein [Labilibacter sediminis]|nr:PKD domain-containing protein [Labilibacter sediminis]
MYSNITLIKELMKYYLCNIKYRIYLKRYTVVLLLLLLGDICLKSQIQVSFTSDSQSGCAPFLVAFTCNVQDGDNYSYLWDFGNGNTSTLKNPQATYPNFGLYSVSLTVSDGVNTEILKKEDFISVHESPVIDFFPKDFINDCAPVAVNFTSSVNPESSSDSYLWDFGDGKLSTEKDPKHIYTDAGIFNVTLIVEDEYGCVAKLSYKNMIKAQKPTAIFQVNENRSCSGELDAIFTNQSYGLGELFYHWDFGDGYNSEEINVTHKYEQDGEFDVSLKVVDDIGCKDSLVIKDYIEISSTIASFEIIRDTVCVGELIVFDNQSVNNKKSFWNFGDGTDSDMISPEHRYNNPGDYSINLSIENYECSDQVTQSIHVEDVQVDFTVSSDYSCQVPVELSYTGISENAVYYDWRFGNGSISDKEASVVNFTLTDGLKNNHRESYSDTLIVTTKYGCKAKLIKKDHVNIVLPETNIIADKSVSGCKPVSLVFSSWINYDTPKDNIVDYSWTLNGKEVSTENSWQNDFTEVGVFDIGLVATTEMGCAAVSSINVGVGEEQVPDFTVKDKTIFCASEMVEFEDLSEDKAKIDFVLWEYGDGTTSELGMPFHFYVDTGFMDVTLWVYQNGCASSVTKEKALYIKGPLAHIERKNICDKPYSPSFEVTLTDADSYSCNFGDGQTISDEGNSFSHTYLNKGAYKVMLTANNTENGCSFSYINNINVFDSKALFDTISLGPCVNNNIVFDPEESKDAEEFSYNNKRNYYLWDFGDNSDKDFTDGLVTHVYKAPGDYDVSLIVKDINNCSDTLKKTVKVYSPQVDFETNYQKGCIPVMFHFKDLSISENQITDWLWSFGDGEYSEEQNTYHEYQNFGNYAVSLKVTDELGCSSSKKLSNEIKVVFPDVDFKVSDASSCINDTLTFFDESESIIESFLWDFGDGVTSGVRNPKHVYSSPGIYDLSLKIIDNHGCESIRSETGFISVQKPPVANFISNNQESNCYPFPVDFEDQSESAYLGSWKWLFGDNQTSSSLQNPKHIYTQPNDYDVTLIAYSTNGCSDTITKNGFIKVGGPYAEINLVDSACIYDNIAFNLINQRNLSSVLWDFGDGVVSTQLSDYHTYNHKGMSYPTLLLNTNSNFACTKVIQDSIYIDEITAAFAFKEDMDKGCVPFQLELINNSVRSDSYFWESSDGFTSQQKVPIHIFNQPDHYDLTLAVSNNFGCKDTAVSPITVFPLPTIKTSKDTFICKDDNVVLYAEGGVGYKWAPSESLDNSFVSDPIASPLETTKYIVEVVDENNCVNTDEVTLTVQQYPFVNFSDSTIIIGESIKLDLSKPDIREYIWSPNIGISCTNCPNPVLNPVESMEYSLALTDTSDCFTMDYPVDIRVQKKYSVDVPTAFTPNKDNVNDYVLVNGWGIQELVYFRIFNRVGEMIFESTDLSEGWNGTYKGKPQNADIYNYVVRVKTYGNEYLNKKGNIKLIR